MDELQRRLAAGEQAAFAELYDLFAPRLQRFLWARLGQASDAADVLQEVFVRLARSRQQLLEIHGDLAPYLFTVARNEACRLLAARQRSEARDRQAAVARTDPNQTPNIELADEARFALAALSDAQREVVCLKIYGGLTLAEIAAATDTPPGTVATRYRTALERMREQLSDNPHER